MKVYVNSDGGAWPSNPGHGAYGVVLREADGGTVVLGDKFYLGDNVSNNEAEWRGLLRGLELAIDHLVATHKARGCLDFNMAAMLKEDEVVLRADSLLVVSQVNGYYNITKPKFYRFREQFHQKAARIGTVTVAHVPREENAEADALVRTIRDKMGKVDGRTNPLDGRRLLFDEVRLLFGDLVKAKYPWLVGDGFLVRVISYYCRQPDRTMLPSCERKVWEEILEKNRERPVLVAYRPYGNRPVPLSTRESGNVTARYREFYGNSDDKGAELLVQFADALVAEDEPARPMTDAAGATKMVKSYGFRGSAVMQFRGVWLPLRELRGLLRLPVSRQGWEQPDPDRQLLEANLEGEARRLAGSPTGRLHPFEPELQNIP